MPGFQSRDELLRARISRFTRMLRGLEKGRGRAIHRTRVASRRLRELIPVLQLDRTTGADLVKRSRKVTKRLGRVRELDVLIQLLDRLHDSRRHDSDMLSRVRGALTERREAAQKKLMARLPVTDVKRLAARLSKIAD